MKTKDIVLRDTDAVVSIIEVFGKVFSDALKMVGERAELFKDLQKKNAFIPSVNWAVK